MCIRDSGSSDGMVYYGLEKEKRTKPCVVTIEEKRLGMLGDDKDTAFLSMAQQAFENRLVSTVYFVGSMFDGGWMQESLKSVSYTHLVPTGASLI